MPDELVQGDVYMNTVSASGSKRGQTQRADPLKASEPIVLSVKEIGLTYTACGSMLSVTHLDPRCFVPGWRNGRRAALKMR